MKLFLVLMVALVVVVQAKKQKAPKVGNECKGEKGDVLRGFYAKNKIEVKVPCKYNAVRQRCGKLDINITPGIAYWGNKYQMDTVWLSIRNSEDRTEWKGRTTNKIAAKFLSGFKNELFAQKGGNVSTSYFFTFNKTVNSKGKETAVALNEYFEFSIRPWNPTNKKYDDTEWSFKCLSDIIEVEPYPRQICSFQDQENKRKIRLNRTVYNDQFMNLTSSQTILFYIFNNSRIEQTNPACRLGHSIFRYLCPNDTVRAETMQYCSQILTDTKQRRCANQHSCGPMEPFLKCMIWGCTNWTNKYFCESLAEDIDLCRPFDADKNGNLTKRIMDANCYQGFQPIN